ncbi:Major outer membrane prolipoprotein Lpp [Candidatus Ecksteinia adelgidicola]|nr:Major outer membrane prolipoprotein Lpp [Candidatus Ecksteinia adelgidicola]
MNCTKLVLRTVILTSVLLTGCSTNNKLEQLSSDVKNLNTKADKISSDVTVIRSDVQYAKENSIRANQRIDNQVHDYKK